MTSEPKKSGKDGLLALRDYVHGRAEQLTRALDGIETDGGPYIGLTGRLAQVDDA